jgi:hypothetical protein
MTVLKTPENKKKCLCGTCRTTRITVLRAACFARLVRVKIRLR